MEAKEFSAKTTEDALAQAQEYFKLPLDQLEFDILDAGAGGLFGLIGSRKAKVLVKPKRSTTQEDMAEMLSVVGGNSDSRPQPQPTTVAAPPPPAQVRDFAASGNNYANENEGENGDDFSAFRAGPPSQEIVDHSQEVLARLAQAIEPDSQVTAQLNGNTIELEINGGEAGILIGRRGQTLESLQYLVTRIVSHKASRAIRISVDTGGYRRRRQESLEELALKLGEKAKNIRRPVSVGPLNSQERRVVHMALRGVNGLSTASRGRGDLKKVVITPR
jgi:spoIIIJ-associated protein